MPPCDNGIAISTATGISPIPMMIWFILAVMLAAVMAVLLWPVWRKYEAADRASFDRAVFRDQLSELDRDMARGLIGVGEAEAARNEISRRLLQAGSGFTKSSRSPLIAVVGVLLIPAVAVPIYLLRGNPDLPDVPLLARLENAVENEDMVALIAKVEAHLAEKPEDAQGWRVLAPAYRRMERWDDAANAYANILRYSAPTAAAFAEYAEMLVFSNRGLVTAEANAAFGEALKLDAKLPKARFFRGIALKQEAKIEAAQAHFQTFLAESPADAPWRPMLEAELREMSAANMTAPDRDAMIRSMVEGLDAKLEVNGDDLEGWQKLIRARTVLNEMDKARAALAAAKAQFRDRPEAVAVLDGLARELKVE